MAADRVSGGVSALTLCRPRWAAGGRPSMTVFASCGISGRLRGHCSLVGGVTGTGDGAALIGVQGVDLKRLVDPLTVLGRLPLQKVPFDVRLVKQTGRTSAGFVGQGQPAVAVRPTTQTVVQLSRSKITAITVETEELVMSSTPNSESTLAADFVQACVIAADTAFLDPSNSGVANAKPASVTFGAPAFASSGNTALLIDGDLGRLADSLIVNGSTLVNAFWILEPLAVSYLTRLRNSGGNQAYPTLSMKGGELMGLPVLVSANVINIGSPQSSSITLLDADRVWLADEAQMEFSASRVAAIQQNDAPTNDSSTPTPSRRQTSPPHSATRYAVHTRI